MREMGDGRGGGDWPLKGLSAPAKASGTWELGNQARGPTSTFPRGQTLSPTWSQAHAGKGRASETQP